ncbi:MAG: PIN domain-containing protein [Deltaproteobacteria bacterium]|nr:PIN domain-containing protein [Deltaproteobacteria bacterium]MBW1872231.1 PIN domain-containing protein [Deltaproteobacteria bacterium]
MIVFDTDVISYVLKPAPPAGLIRRLANVEPTEQATTAITAGELLYGACRSSKTKSLLKALDELVWPNLKVLPFDRRAAFVYGRLRADLEAAGTPISEPDLRIGSICLSREAVLATGNERHFRKIPGLKIENWLAAYR